MLIKRSKSRTTFLLCFVPFGLIAQNVLPVSAGNAGGAGGTANYTVGQMVTANNTGSTGSVEAGIQQPYEITVIAGLNETSINLNCAIYPNPTKDCLLLKIESQVQKRLVASIFDSKGKVLIEKSINEFETKFSMSNLNSGIYFLRIYNNKKEIKLFKIIKN